MLRHVLILLLLLIPFTAQARQSANVDAAQALVQMLASGDTAGVYDQFSDPVKAVLSQDQFDQAWQTILTQAGAFQQVTSVSEDPANHLVVLTLQFEKAPLDLHVAFDADGKVSGFRFTPSASTPTLEAPTPTYADTSAFTETPVTVGTYDLPGILTMPVGDGPFPAVVLISGSGPNDHDETVGPNKPFRDLAWGLAEQGIATLRYDKSTLAAVDQLDLASLTLKEEYVDDALAAVALLRETEGIDPEQVYILGHSLGGYAAPRIAQADPDIAGVIIASGLAQPLPETVLRQTRYLLSLSEGTPAPDATEEPRITQTQDLVDQINSLTADSPADTVIFGAAPAYWLDLRGYDPVALAASLPQRILVLQGERDYQVTVADDLRKWQAGLADHPDTTFKTFPDLNHLYVTGEGMSTPAEYNQPGNVAPEVIDAIAAWVKSHE